MIKYSVLPSSRRTCMEILVGSLALASMSVPKSVLAQTLKLPSIRIATIGAGHEGGAIGTLFAKLGHPVMFSSRHPQELKELVAAAGPTAQAGTVADAANFGEVVFLVVPYTAIPQIGQEFGAVLATKPLVIDVSNPVAARDGQEFVNQVTSEGGPGLYTAKCIQGAKIVRAFNALHTPSLEKIAHRPDNQGGPIGVPIAGDNPSAIELASRLIREVGFEPVLIGDLAKGKYLVPGTPLAGQHTPAELRQIASTLT